MRAALVVIATVFALYEVVFVPFRCTRAATYGATALDAHDTPRVAARVHGSLRDCGYSHPNAHVSFTLGGASETLGDHRQAIIEYQRALTIERRPEIYFALGMAQLQVMDRAAAIENLTRACAFDPARLGDIQYPEIRDEVARRIRATYGPDWLP